MIVGGKSQACRDVQRGSQASSFRELSESAGFEPVQNYFDSPQRGRQSNLRFPSTSSRCSIQKNIPNSTDTVQWGHWGCELGVIVLVWRS